MCIFSQYLSYYPVQEYHYTTLLPVLPVLLWLRQRESVSWLRRLLTASFLVSLAVFLPTANFLAPNAPARYWAFGTMLRVLPAAVAFLALTVYGAASAWFAAANRHRATV